MMGMKPVQVTVRLDPELAQDLREAVVYSRTTAQAVLEQAVRHYVAHSKKWRASRLSILRNLGETVRKDGV